MGEEELFFMVQYFYWLSSQKFMLILLFSLSRFTPQLSNKRGHIYINKYKYLYFLKLWHFSLPVCLYSKSYYQVLNIYRWDERSLDGLEVANHSHLIFWGLKFNFRNLNPISVFAFQCKDLLIYCFFLYK